MQKHLPTEAWAFILGASSGIGLATAQKLAAEGLNLILVHRDRKKELPKIQEAFDQIASGGVQIERLNVNALQESGQVKIKDALLKYKGKIRIFVHSLSRGNLRPLNLLERPLVDPVQMQESAGLEGAHQEMVFALKNWQSFIQQPAPKKVLEQDDFGHTIGAMATNLLTWVQFMHQHQLFMADARVIALTSEGTQKVWPQYAAVAAAKAVLESLVRYMAVSFAPFGIRTNAIQAGITNTPSLQMIPGNEALRAATVLRNPFGRLTRPEDIANVIAFMARDEAAWINGAIIPVDGGESLS